MSYFDSRKNDELLKCIDRMVTLYIYDTIILLDKLLTEDEDCSATVIYDRLKEYLLFDKLLNDKVDEIDVFEWIRTKRYSTDDIIFFKKKIKEQ